RSLLLPRLTSRQRALQLMMTMGIVTMALCVVLGSSMPVRDLAARLLPGSLSMSAAVGSPDVELFYIDRGLPWAHISLDGHPIAHLPAIGVDPPFRFTNGHHQLLWRADPFQSQTCVITIPLNLGAGVCLFNASVQLKSGVIAWIVRFF